MIIKVFRVSTKELFTFKNKYEFFVFVQEVTHRFPSYSTSIDKLMKYLPVEDFCRVV